MDFGLDLLRTHNALDDTLLVDEVGGTEDADGSSAAGHLFSPATKRLQELCGGVRDERKLQSLRLGEFRLCLLLVLAHTDDDIAFCLQLRLWA